MRHAAFASDGNAERLDCTHVISKFCQSEERHGGRKSGNNERMADCHPPEQRWIVIAKIIFCVVLTGCAVWDMVWPGSRFRTAGGQQSQPCIRHAKEVTQALSPRSEALL